MNHSMASEKDLRVFQEQDKQYEFPYHHTAHFLPDGTAMRVRDLDWGFDYLACILHVKKIVESRKPASVLEVGCGDGAVLGALSQDISRRVGVDLSEKAIAFAKAFFPDLDFRVEDASSMQETFDVVMAVEVLEHIPDDHVSLFLKTLADRTKPGGLIYLSVPSTNLPLYPKHHRHYDPALLETQIKNAGLEVSITQLRYFRSPVFLEKLYKRLTRNRYWVGEFHPLRKLIWKKITSELEVINPKTAQHIIAVLEKK